MLTQAINRIMLFWLVLTFAAQARLLPCPERANPVSTRACFWARCSLVIGQILKAEATQGERENASKQVRMGKRGGDAVRPGVVAEFADGQLLVESNAAACASLEIAGTADLARLARPATNLTALVLASNTATKQTSRHEETWVGESTNLLRVAGCRGLPAGGSLTADQTQALRWSPEKNAGLPQVDAAAPRHQFRSHQAGRDATGI